MYFLKADDKTDHALFWQWFDKSVPVGSDAYIARLAWINGLRSLKADTSMEHDGDLHKAVFMALESYGGADTFRDGVLALVELALDRYTEMMANKDLLRDVERRILKHQACVPMSRRDSGLVTKIRADIKRALGVIK